MAIACGLMLAACSNSFDIYRDANAFKWPQKVPPGPQLELLEAELSEKSRIKAVVVIQDGHLVFEKYGKGMAFDAAWNIKSGSKSIISVLAGIAWDQGSLDTNASLAEVLGSSTPSTPRVMDLLRMTGGFPESSGEFYGIAKKSSHPVEEYLKTRNQTLPPDSAIYSTIGVNLLGYAIAKSVNQPLSLFGETRLFAPLGIKVAYWPEDRVGNAISGADFYITARDFSRIGYLMLQGGAIDGKNIVSTEWIKAATIPQVKLHNQDYGYLWWIDSGSRRRNYYAAGYRGQVMYISPESQSVAVVFADYKDYTESLAIARRLTDILLGHGG